MKERIAASIRVNQAPVGTFVSADERYTPSKAPNTKKKNKTMKRLICHLMIATSATIEVVMSVTHTTHTP